MLLKKLCEINAVSGNEGKVREHLKQIIAPYVDSIHTDKIGNLIAVKSGASEISPTVLLCAHMDEIGLMITEITTEGYLKFQLVGGMDIRILVSKQVVISDKVKGVIGSKAIHLQKKDERKKALDLEKLYIDIGVNTKEEAEKLVRIGDYACFDVFYEEFGANLIKAKAFDDRAGCYLITEILHNVHDCKIIAAFTVQEEVGLRGSKVLSNNIQADFAIILESTNVMDICENREDEWVGELGRGPICSVIDRTTIYNNQLVKHIFNIAKEFDIPLQYRKGANGGNDAGKVHLACNGIPTITLSIPCRNIHSMNSVISKDDLDSCEYLVNKVLEKFSLNKKI
ncbi:MAG: M20/M25/M40 family metallo-hydrolase [Eubacteriales bacterium]